MRLVILFIIASNFGFQVFGKIPKSIHGTNVVDCEKQAKELLDNEENFSTALMNEVSGLERQCILNIMNKKLDARLVLLKKDNSKQFKKEMVLQAEFNKSVKNFEDYYRSKCSGSSCGSCSPSSTLYKYRSHQVEMILNRSLEALAVVKKIEIASKDAEQFFSGFAKQFCDLPKDVWKQEKAPENCVKLVEGEIAETLKVFYVISKNDGDVCAQL